MKVINDVKYINKIVCKITLMQGHASFWLLPSRF